MRIGRRSTEQQVATDQLVLTDGKLKGSSTSRRALLLSGGVALGEASIRNASDRVEGVASSLTTEGKDVVAGTVDRITDGVLYLRDGIGAMEITFTNDASFWRDHAVDLSAYKPGDLVAVEGNRRKDGFVAMYLTSVYVVGRGRLVDKSESNRRTTGPTMLLTRDSYLRGERGIEDDGRLTISEGEEVVALGRDDPEMGFMAIAISVDSQM